MIEILCRRLSGGPGRGSRDVSVEVKSCSIEAAAGEEEEEVTTGAKMSRKSKTFTTFAQDKQIFTDETNKTRFELLRR